MHFETRHHTIVATDVAKSSGRNDDLLLRMRRDLREILADTFARQGLDPGRLTRLDDGDGFRYLIPADVAPPHAALDPFVHRLGIELRRHREAASEANRLRLRVAVHSGLLYAESDGGWTGVPLKDCARLLDADAGRDLLDRHPSADLVLLVSDTVYHEVVGSGTTLDPADFTEIRVRVKEADRTAWAHVPAAVPGPASGSGPAQRSPDRRPPSSSTSNSGIWIDGDRHTFHGPIVGGNFSAGPGGSGG